MKKRLSILGSTGSIGQSTLDVVRAHPDRFEVVALACGRNLDLALKQVREFKPNLLSVSSQEAYKEIRSISPPETQVLFGLEGAEAVAAYDSADYVVSAIVGAAGLRPTLAALKAGKTVGLANKESLVTAGPLVSRVARAHQATLIPIDSEHSAIFQCLNGENIGEVHRLILTASGGPFRQKTTKELNGVTVREALKHPNWDMGAKITIDSATLMNKGLELIEARWLFDLRGEKLEVHVHPKSIVHSLVEFQDGSLMAQLGMPDMRVPIAYALAYPNRLKLPWPRLDLTQVGALEFFKPDLERFPCLALATSALQQEKSAPAVLNAANEVAVAAFLEEKINFMDIPRLVEKTLEVHETVEFNSLEEVLEVDQWAREKAGEFISNLL